MGTISCSSASALKAHMEKDHQSTIPKLTSQSGHRSARLRDPTISTSQNINGPRIADMTPIKFPSLSGPQPLKDCPNWLKFKYDHDKFEFPVDELGLAPDKVKRLGDDWCAVFNPDIPRTFDVERLNTFDGGKRTAFSHDGRFLAVEHQIFDVNTGVLVKSLNSDEDDSVLCLCFSPDDRYLAIGYDTGFLKASLLIYILLR